eukprot:gene48822-17900_t
MWPPPSERRAALDGFAHRCHAFFDDGRWDLRRGRTGVRTLPVYSMACTLQRREHPSPPSLICGADDAQHGDDQGVHGADYAEQEGWVFSFVH